MNPSIYPHLIYLKFQGYILKDGSYSKKLRIGLQKKPRVNGKEMLSNQHFIQQSV
jgi:hypothetical protein